MNRHAAHGDVLAEMLAALRQRDAERARRIDRILEEELVEIAHSIEEQAAGIGGLDLDELLHHRSGRRAALFRGQLGDVQDITRGGLI